MGPSPPGGPELPALLAGGAGRFTSHFCKVSLPPPLGKALGGAPQNLGVGGLVPLITRASLRFPTQHSSPWRWGCNRPPFTPGLFNSVLYSQRLAPPFPPPHPPPSPGTHQHKQPSRTGMQMKVGKRTLGLRRGGLQPASRSLLWGAAGKRRLGGLWRAAGPGSGGTPKERKLGS